MSERTDCWNQIGVYGDNTCPELARYIRCLNCPVYSNAGRELLDREPPAGYVEEWTQILSAEKEAKATGTISVVIFRLGNEWFAFPTPLLQEVTEVKTVRTLPHRSGKVLLGLVNVRGELQLCVSAVNVLRVEKPDAVDPSPRRMIVAEKEGYRWVFPVDEIASVHRIHPSELNNLPVTVSKSETNYMRGVFLHEGKQVGFLDDELFFFNLRRSVF